MEKATGGTWNMMNHTVTESIKIDFSRVMGLITIVMILGVSIGMGVTSCHYSSIANADSTAVVIDTKQPPPGFNVLIKDTDIAMTYWVQLPSGKIVETKFWRMKSANTYAWKLYRYGIKSEVNTGENVE